MNIRIEQKENINTITIIGDITLVEINELREKLKDMADVKEIHIDVSGVEYADSSFLSLIIGIKKQYQDKEIKILNPNDFIVELLNITGFGRFFTIIITK
jgi:anti-anti-sigma factor